MISKSSLSGITEKTDPLDRIVSGSLDCYKQFYKLFDRVKTMKENGMVPKSVEHTRLSTIDIDKFEFSSDLNNLRQVQLVAIRNFESYPLAPCLNKR